MSDLFNMKLMIKLPEDVIVNNILPYTYIPKPKHHLEDIRSCVEDYSLVESVYMTQLNEFVLLNDLLRFLYINISPSYGIENIFDNVLRRHFTIKNKNEEKLINIVIIWFHRNVQVNAERKIKMVWGLLKPCERKKFINKYIANN
jgi:hypothetical protein